MPSGLLSSPDREAWRCTVRGDDYQIVRRPMDCAVIIHDSRVLLSSHSDSWSKCWATRTKTDKSIQKFVYQEEEGESSTIPCNLAGIVAFWMRMDWHAGTDSDLCPLVFCSSGAIYSLRSTLGSDESQPDLEPVVSLLQTTQAHCRASARDGSCD